MLRPLRWATNRIEPTTAPTSEDSIEIHGNPHIVSTIKGGVNGDIATCAITINAVKQVLLNLFNNALDAMPGGGKLRLATEQIGNGVRVPLAVISPYARAHFVSHVVQDHTAITRFIEAVFDVPALTSRDAKLVRRCKTAPASAITRPPPAERRSPR